MSRTRKTPTTETTPPARVKTVNKVLSKEELINNIRLSLKCKNETQKKLINNIKENDVTICSGPAGTGKAQPLDSLILTPNGYVEMGNIKIGDEVIGVDGIPIKVNGVYPQGEKDIYLVTFSDGTTTECCGDHLWLTQTYEERNYKKRVKNDDGVRTRIGERGKKGSVRNTIEIMNTLTVGIKSKKTNHSIPMVKPIEFIKKEVNIDPYLLGCLLGDGGFTTANITFTSADDDIIEEIKKNLPLNHVIQEKYKHNYNIKSIGVKKNDISEFLKEINLFGLKSNDKFIPEEYLINNIETRLEMLRGLMDTDGSVDKKSGTPLFYSTSEKLIKGVTFIVQSLGGVVTKKEKIGKYKKLNGEVKECKTIYTLHINLPFNFIPFKLKRKISLLKERTKYTPIRYIKNIEKIGKKEAQCISVSDENHLYLTNDCIVTHNTLISIYEALMLLKTNPSVYKEIKLVKSITQLKNEEIGTLPGDEMDKLKFHMMSFLDAFHKLIGEDLTNKLIESGVIKMEVFGAIRGRSFTNAIIIIDEFQNISKDNGKTFLTRFSEDTKVIVLGDSGQIDLKDKRLSALEPLINNVLKRPEEGVGVVTFSETEVVRHRLTSYFINIFENIQKDDEPKKQTNQSQNGKVSIKQNRQANKKLSLFRKIKIFFKRRFN